MSTTVVYASGDSGHVYGDDATYLTAARGDGSVTRAPSATVVNLGQALSGVYFAWGVFLKWDTSAVGTDTVSNVDFEVDGQTAADAGVVEGYEYDWGATLETTDFRDSDAGIPALGSIISTYDTVGFDAGTGYTNDLGANAAFASAINGSGDTRVVVISQDHRNETAPTGVERVIFECTGNTNDARLTITHATASHVVSPTDDITTTGWTVA